MSNKLIFEKSIEVEELFVKYQVIQRDDVFEETSYTFYDIAVEKISQGKTESCVCSSLTTNRDTAEKICNLICENIVLPETLFESLEECLEVVL